MSAPDRDTLPAPKPMGFAAIDPALQREIASKGGKAAHACGRAHTFTSEEARVAGRLGHKALLAKRGREHFEEIGRKGDAERARRRAERERA